MNHRISLAIAAGVLSSFIGCANSAQPPETSKTAVTTTVAVRVSPTAVDAVRGFYEGYLATFAKNAATPDIAMSKAFKTDIQKSAQACKGHNDEPCGWGADAMPYLNSQDYDDDLNYARSGIRFNETAPNTVRVDLNVLPSEPDGGKTTIVFNMVQENGRWVADDMLYPDGKSLYSARKMLADERASLSTRIQFAKGAINATVSGKFSGFDDEKSYVIGVGKGQTMTVEQVKAGNKRVTLGITAPNGEDVSDMDLSCNNSKKVSPTMAGDYTINVRECMKADPWKGSYRLNVTVK